MPKRMLESVDNYKDLSTELMLGYNDILDITGNTALETGIALASIHVICENLIDYYERKYDEIEEKALTRLVLHENKVIPIASVKTAETKA